MARTAEQIVNAEVHYCVSYLVSTLAGGYGLSIGPLADIAEQAMELAAPIADYEEAAFQEGWRTNSFGGVSNSTKYPELACLPDWRAACEATDVEPYDREVYEHWIVSDWLGDRLSEKGEKVDNCFAGLTVWARTTTGQGIAIDSVIEAITADLTAS